MSEYRQPHLYIVLLFKLVVGSTAVIGIISVGFIASLIIGGGMLNVGSQHIVMNILWILCTIPLLLLLWLISWKGRAVFAVVLVIGIFIFHPRTLCAEESTSVEHC